MNLELIQTIGIATCLIIAGEALALLAGLLIFKKPTYEWANHVNIALVSSDLIMGGFLLQYYLGLIVEYTELDVLLLIMAIIATHSYRASQTLRMARNPYCFNKPLGIINWIKLAGVLVLFVNAAQAI